MSYALLVATILAVGLLALASSVQLLYLESLRLRTRDLPSLEFFKSAVEEKIGLETDEGALSFSLIKHTTLAVLGCLVLADFLTRRAHLGDFSGSLFRLAVANDGGGLRAYRRFFTGDRSGKWLAPLIPLLRALTLAMKPATATLNFFYKLVEVGRQSEQERGASHSGREYRGAHRGGRRGRSHSGGRPQADSVGGRVRRQGGARGDDAAPQHRSDLGGCHARGIAATRHQRAVLAHSRSTKARSTRSSASFTCATCSSSTRTSAPAAACAS